MLAVLTKLQRHYAKCLESENACSESLSAFDENLTSFRMAMEQDPRRFQKSFVSCKEVYLHICICNYS